MYQSKMLSQKEKRMITFFRHSKIPKYKVHLAYHSIYKSLQFLLGVTMMANSISKRTMWAVIGVMNINQSLPHTLAFARTKLLGLGLCNHYCIQGITHCKQIIQHL
jgi:hypothetical protein